MLSHLWNELMWHQPILLYWVNFYHCHQMYCQLLLLILMIWYYFTYIVLVNYFIIDTNTWLCICLFLQSNEFIKRTVTFNIDMSKVQISYSIITVWCIQIIWIAAVDVWIYSSTSPLIILVQNLPAMFSSCRHNRHIYFSFVKQYLDIIKTNLKIDKTFNSMIIKRLLITWKIQWLTKFYFKIIEKDFFFVQMQIHYNTQTWTWL